MQALPFEPYILLLTLVGALVLASAALPRLLRSLPLSMPMVLLFVGGAIGLLGMAAPIPEPDQYPELTERVTEILVTISLMSAGLKLDTPVGWRRWGLVWRLLGIAMPLSIVLIALTGWSLLGLAPASALLLGAVLAPTDPVLAAEVQVGRPGEGDGSRVRFALTAEAGLNDGLAFPFVALAVAWTLHAADASVGWLGHWLAVDLVWRVAAGVAMGWLSGRLAAWLLFRWSRRLAETRSGFAVVGLTAVAYGLTELVHGYGFLGVFVAGLVLRAAERRHEFHGHLHDFATDMEQLALAVLLLLLGASFTSQFLPLVTWPMLLAALAILLLARPISGVVGLIGTPEPWAERIAIAFFGIRGVGSFYYLAYAATAAQLEDTSELWATVTLVVALSILLHGACAGPWLRRLEESVPDSRRR